MVVGTRAQERFYFGDNVLPCFESAIPMLKNRLHDLPDADNVSALMERICGVLCDALLSDGGALVPGQILCTGMCAWTRDGTASSQAFVTVPL